MIKHTQGGRRMKKGLKKFLALGLSTVLAVGALAGCGNQEAQERLREAQQEVHQEVHQEWCLTMVVLIL